MMAGVSRLILIAALSFVFVACESRDGVDELPSTLQTAADDTAMNSAIVRARNELTEFETALSSPVATQTNFAVKVALPHEGGQEHIWLATPAFEADSVVGVVESAPLYVKNVPQGARIKVDRDAISDWMYLDDGKLKGGYTMRVAIERMPAGERDEQKRAMGIE